MKLRNIAAVAALSLAAVGSANAAFITGSATLFGQIDNAGLTGLPTSVVSGLTSFDLTGAISGFGTGGLAGLVSPGTISDFALASGTSMSIALGPVSFTSASFGAPTSSSLSCVSSATGGFTCTDNVEFDFTGAAAAAGFDMTGFSATFSATGTCVSADGATCASDALGSYSISLSATGVAAPPVVVPEPASLALVGLALAGVAAARRRA